MAKSQFFPSSTQALTPAKLITHASLSLYLYNIYLNKESCWFILGGFWNVLKPDLNLVNSPLGPKKCKNGPIEAELKKVLSFTLPKIRDFSVKALT